MDSSHSGICVWSHPSRAPVCYSCSSCPCRAGRRWHSYKPIGMEMRGRILVYASSLTVTTGNTMVVGMRWQDTTATVTLGYRSVRKSGNIENPQPTINSSPMRIIPVSSKNVMIVSPCICGTPHPPYSAPVSAHDEPPD